MIGARIILSFITETLIEENCQKRLERFVSVLNEVSVSRSWQTAAPLAREKTGDELEHKNWL